MKTKPYLEIFSPDHWFKNLFNLPGILLCLFFYRVPPLALSLRGPAAGAGDAGDLLEVDLEGVVAGEDRLSRNDEKQKTPAISGAETTIHKR